MACPRDLARGARRVGRAKRRLNRYPDPSASALKARLREAMAVPAGMELLLGNGSDEIIQVLALAVNKPGRGAARRRAVVRHVPHGRDLRRPALCRAYRSLRISASTCRRWRALSACIVLRSPFSPIPTTRPATCSTPLRSSASSELSPGLVVVDEAYHAFAGGSFLPRLERHPEPARHAHARPSSGLPVCGWGCWSGRDEWLQRVGQSALAL